MRTYGQYCPIARTSELFAERWTPILIRNLLGGADLGTGLSEQQPEALLGTVGELEADDQAAFGRQGDISELARRPKNVGCLAYPGRAEDLIVSTDSETLARWHLRDHTYEEAVSADKLKINGAPRSVRAFLRCIRPSPFEPFERA